MRDAALAERVGRLLEGRPFIVEPLDATTVEVLYDPPDDSHARNARNELHGVSQPLREAGLVVEQVDMSQWTPGLMPGVPGGTRTPPRSRRIIANGPPRLRVREP